MYPHPRKSHNAIVIAAPQKKPHQSFSGRSVLHKSSIYDTLGAMLLPL